MTLTDPIWLLVALPLLVVSIGWPLPGRRLRVFRALMLAAIVLALAGATIKIPRRDGTLILVADRSDSMPADTGRALAEMAAMLRSRMGRRDRFGLVAFGADAAIEAAPGSQWSGKLEVAVDQGQSNLAGAIETGLALVAKNRQGRLLVVSDGRWTGVDPARAGGGATLRGIPIDFRLLERPPLPDTAILRISAPAEIPAGQSFLVHAWIQSEMPQTVSFRLERDGVVIADGERDMATRRPVRLAFRDQIKTPGAAIYRLRIDGSEPDPVAQNNTARFIVGVSGKLPVLLVSETPGGGLADVLGHSGMSCVTRPPGECDWSLAGLAPYAGVIIENVRADDIGARGMTLLPDWVESAGRGLMLTGGRRAYGTGGYFGSPLERVMPVSMELRQEHRKLAMALVVVLDRSGSMTAPVSGGKTKMDLANIGTAQVLDLLSGMDEFGVIAVDSAPHTIMPLQDAATARGNRGRILAIESMGGGIYVYEALKAATAMVASSSRATRHIILFSDAADTEQPGDYVALLEKCRQAGITVSVIALGTPQDADAKLCEDIALKGGGNIYFTHDATQIPRLFAQDTFTVARSTFVEETTTVDMLPTLSLIAAGRHFAGPVEAGGFNLCYAREEAMAGAVTRDEFTAPFAAWWQAGAGRVMAYLGEVDGKHTGPIAAWPDYASLLGAMAQWAAGSEQRLPDGMVLTRRIIDGALRIELHCAPGQDSGGGLAPRLTLIRDRGEIKPTVETVPLAWDDIGVLGKTVPLAAHEVVQPVLDLGQGDPPIAMAPVCLPYSPEFLPGSSRRGTATLRELAIATGGRERLSLENIWEEMPAGWLRISLVPWLCALAALLFLIEIFDRRVGFAALRRTPAKAAAAGAATPGGAGAPAARQAVGRQAGISRAPAADPKPARPTGAAAKGAPSPPPGEGMASALRKANARARQRLNRDQQP
jgi:Mg-chelatase subunit ChlD